MARDPTDSTASVTSTVANHVVAVMREYTGRGPTKARAYITDDIVTVVVQNALSKGENNLVRNDAAALVLSTRRAYQEGMRRALIDGVQTITGRDVVAFMSGNSADPDYAVETFILGGERAAGAPVAASPS